MRPKVYTASCLSHALKWRNLARNSKGIEWTAHWPKEVLAKENGGKPRDAWCLCQQDILRSDILICYFEERDKPRGCLIETGMALALGKQVFLACPEDHYHRGDWHYHPGVTWVPQVENAIEFILRYP